MNSTSMIRSGTARAAMGTAIAAVIAAGLAATPATPAAAKHPVGRARAPASAAAPTASGTPLMLGISRGQLVTLPRPMTDVFIADDKIADVQVRSPTQLYVFGKTMGETTLSATGKDGSVVFTTTVRVGNNITSIGQMLKLALPDAQITATPMNGLVLLTGTVSAPDDIEEANRLVSAYVGQAYQVISRIKAATPMQVMLRVRFAEVNRDIAQTIGNNIISRDPGGSNGIGGGISQGTPGTIDPYKDPNTGLVTPNKSMFTLAPITGSGTRFGIAGHLLGLDVLSALDLAETDGYATTLAQPTLTALSGETASFLAGGEIPIPVPQYQGVTTIEYKQYGVSLAFTPTVLADGRISMRVRPEVSQLTSSTVAINGYQIPGLTTRRTETTVELGSGQSFVIGGLLSSNSNNSIDKAPFLGDLPILGQLFRSNSFKKSESELVIVVTPYLVRPVSDSQITLPTDGYQAPTDAQRLLLNRAMDSTSAAKRALPRAEAPVTDPAPGTPVTALPAEDRRKGKQPDAAPGFSFN